MRVVNHIVVGLDRVANLGWKSGGTSLGVCTQIIGEPNVERIREFLRRIRLSVIKYSQVAQCMDARIRQLAPLTSVSTLVSFR